TPKMVITTSGNVGIGTTTPSAKLTVAGDTYIGGDVTATGTVTFTDLGTGLVQATNGVLSIATAGTDYLATTTGNWTATFDGQEGRSYLNRANPAGTQTLSTISDAGALAALDDLSTFSTTDLAEGTNLYFTNTRARSAISETVTGIDYATSTGIFSLTANY